MAIQDTAINVASGLPWGTLTAVAVAVIIALKAVNLAKDLRRVVKPNVVHIVQKRASTINYGKGFDGGNAYWEWPEWIPVIGLTKIALPLSIFDLDLKNYEAYDEDKVPFMVDVKAFFVINQPSVAAERVSDMRELMEQLTGILQGTVRTVLAKHPVEKIMVDRSTFGELFTKETSEQLKEWGVRNAKPIELMDIRDGTDSKTITRIMAKKESKIEKESRVEVAVNIKDAEIAEIDADREKDVRAQQAKQLVGERTAEKEKMVGVANELAQQTVQEQAAITAERNMAVHRVTVVRDAEIRKDARIVKADEEKRTKIINSEAIKQERIIVAEGQKAETVTVAEGDFADAQFDAKGILAIGTSTAEAERLIQMARVTPELELAKEIGENESYQTYLIRIAEVAKDEEVGKEQAKALQRADVKVISNTGDVVNGVDNVMELFSSKGGTSVGAMLEAAAQTPAGAAVINKITGKSANGTGSRI